MGSTLLGPLHRTRRWREVIGLIQLGATARQVAQASVHAAQRGLASLYQDPGTRHAVQLLMLMPQAARGDDMTSEMAALGLHLPDDPGVFDLVVAYTEAVDAALPLNRGRTDLGEMAQLATVEALAAHLDGHCKSLFGHTPGGVRSALSSLHDPRRFGGFARDYFARLVFRVLDYSISRVLPGQVGEGCRFLTLREARAFQDAMRQHCSEAACVVVDFVADWVGGRRRDGVPIDLDAAATLTHGAVCKVIAVFLEEGQADAA